MEKLVKLRRIARQRRDVLRNGEPGPSERRAIYDKLEPIAEGPVALGHLSIPPGPWWDHGKQKGSANER